MVTLVPFILLPVLMFSGASFIVVTVLSPFLVFTIWVPITVPFLLLVVGPILVFLFVF